MIQLADFDDTCLDACQQCATACNQCAAACLQEQDVAMMARCIALDLDCAALCTLVADTLARGSEFAPAVCALCAHVCDSCGEECARHEMEHCQACAQACHTCAAECRQMASQQSGRGALRSTVEAAETAEEAVTS